MKIVKVFAAFIFLFVTAQVNGQFHIGAKAGLNATKIEGKTFKQEFEYNYLVGGFAEIGLGNRFSINPEVLFSQASATRDSSVSKDIIYNKDQITAKMNYLSIPILANVKLAGPLHIEVGPQYSILLNSDKNFLQNGQSAFKKGDFSMIGGIQLKMSKIRLSGRYVVGLDNISDTPNSEKWKSQALQLALGLAIF